MPYMYIIHMDISSLYITARTGDTLNSPAFNHPFDKTIWEVCVFSQSRIRSGSASVWSYFTGCSCDECGTRNCEHFSGVCECFENVIGEDCDRCAQNHWGFASCQVGGRRMTRFYPLMHIINTGALDPITSVAVVRFQFSYFLCNYISNF